MHYLKPSCTDARPDPKADERRRNAISPNQHVGDVETVMARMSVYGQMDRKGNEVDLAELPRVKGRNLHLHQHQVLRAALQALLGVYHGQQ